MDGTAVGIALASGLGGIFIVAGAAAHWRSRRACAWPSADGEIVRSDLIEHRGDDWGDAPSYAADVAYVYHVDGTRYEATRIAFGYDSMRLPETVAAFKLRRYPLGARVRVFYNPQAPGDAVLEPGRARYALALIGFGAALAAGGVGLLFAVQYLDNLFL